MEDESTAQLQPRLVSQSITIKEPLSESQRPFSHTYFSSSSETKSTTPHQSVTSVRTGRRPKGKQKAAKDSVPEDVQLLNHLPVSTEKALKTFHEIDQNSYQNKSLGLTKQSEDSMLCECSWSPGDDLSFACSDRSGCINYLTQVECLLGECKCREMCQNQRFQKRLYAPLDIVLTEKKGFGMRLTENVPAETFVYEYVGEVVGEKAFQKRMKDYAVEGLKHFYFMQLQKDEVRQQPHSIVQTPHRESRVILALTLTFWVAFIFLHPLNQSQYIDATKKGGLGRFLNHSCNPNCYISKWFVGRQLRMGIFTKRSVRRGEELTFNYNVDRYGHAPQECHCGESNCVGYLGGRTQTDVGAMDELYIDALGIEDDMKALAVKGSKTKRSGKMDIDYVPAMKPISIDAVPKVASAIRQSTSNRRILSKLLNRISVTDDSAVQKQLMRLHGFSLMSMVLNEYLEDEDILKTTLEILLKWPLITRNKLVSSNIEGTVMKLSASPSETIRTLAEELVKMWVALEVSYRIPRDMKQGVADVDGRKRQVDGILDQIFSKRVRETRSGNVTASVKLVSDTAFIRPEAAKPVDPSNIKPENLRLPPNWAYEKTSEGRVYYYHVVHRRTQWTIPTPADVARVEKELAELNAQQKAAANNVAEIVAKVKADIQSLRAASGLQPMAQCAEQERILVSSMKSLSSSRTDNNKRHQTGQHGQEPESSRAASFSEAKDRKLLRLFSGVVVQTMSRYKHLLEHDQFKKRAKELTNLLCQKEARSIHYARETYESLSREKELKIRAFTKDWVIKLLARKRLRTTPSVGGKFVEERNVFLGEESSETGGLDRKTEVPTRGDKVTLVGEESSRSSSCLITQTSP